MFHLMVKYISNDLVDQCKISNHKTIKVNLSTIYNYNFMQQLLNV